MSLRIIQPRRTEQRVEYSLCFEWADMPGAGFSFPCNEDGTVLPLTSEAAKSNYADCLRGCNDAGLKIAPKGVRTYRWTARYPTVGQCCPGEDGKVYLDGFTNTCEKCGRDYNMSGQLLAPRHMWGEETGEIAADILAGGDYE